MARSTLFAVLTAGFVGTALVLAQPATDTRPGQPGRDAKPAQPTGQPTGDMQLPPGMTPEMMMACMEAATPGEEHAFLQKAVGTWEGKNKMWMAPNTEPMLSTGTTRISPMFEGRFTKAEMSGEMPGGMGQFDGFCLTGYDNVAQTFQAVWIDNMGTGMMIGTGKLSDDQKTLTWNYTYNCPMTKAPKPYRIVERFTGPDTYTMEMFGPDLEGTEYRMMEIRYTRTSKTAAAPTDAATDAR
jgi:hypothetical protein